MIYVRRRGTISRYMSGYVQADTSTSDGWRPQYKQLGSMLPNWKTVAAQRDAIARHNAQLAAAHQHARSQHLAAVDAHARGQRLSGLGAIDPGSAMQKGTIYTFHFNGTLGNPAPQDIATAVSADTNFIAVSASNEPGGGLFSSNFYVTFTYNGQGASVLGAGAEMAGVISDAFPNVWGGYTFVSADGPGNPSTNNPSGITTPNPNSGSNNNNPSNPTNWALFFQNNLPLILGGGLALVVVSKIL